MPRETRLVVLVAALATASMLAPSTIAAEGSAAVETDDEATQVLAGAGTVSGRILLVGSLECAATGQASIQAVQGSDGEWNATYTLTTSCLSYEDTCSEESRTSATLVFDCLFARSIVLGGFDGDAADPADAESFELVIRDPLRPGVIEGTMVGASATAPAG